MNNVQLLGRLTADVDLRYFQSANGDQARASFRIAVDRPAKQDGTHETDFINCIAWGRRAEVIADYFHKGSKIAISGKIRTGSYQNKEGATVYTFDIEVTDLDFIDPKETQQPNAADPTYTTAQGQQYYRQAQSAPSPAPQPAQQQSQRGRAASTRSGNTRSSGRSAAPAQSTQRAAAPRQNAQPVPTGEEPFLDIPDGVADEGLPFT